MADPKSITGTLIELPPQLQAIGVSILDDPDEGYHCLDPDGNRLKTFTHKDHAIWWLKNHYNISLR